MSSATPRGDALLKMDDPKPFILVEFEQPRGVHVSWGDQIDDDDVVESLVVALCAMTGADPEKACALFGVDA